MKSKPKHGGARKGSGPKKKGRVRIDTTILPETKDMLIELADSGPIGPVIDRAVSSHFEHNKKV